LSARTYTGGGDGASRGGVDEGTIATEVPHQTQLLGSYPNPFNPSTTIRFDIAEPTFVSLKVFDVLGQEVATLTNEMLQPGSYSKLLDANTLSSGVYLYRMQAGRFSETRKIILTK
jgi:hypothetical protein